VKIGLHTGYSEPDGVVLDHSEIEFTRAISTTTKRNVADMGSYTSFSMGGWLAASQAQPLLNFDANRQGCRISCGELPGGVATAFGVAVGKRKAVDNFIASGRTTIAGLFIIPNGGYLPIANNEELFAFPVGTPDINSYVSVMQERWRDIYAVE
jgi:hypothetical protein